MANRAMNAKLARARAQAREAAEIEFTKPCYIMQRPRHELRAMVRSFGDVKRFPTVRPKPRDKWHGDPRRRGSILTADVYAFDTRLIRRNDREGSHA
jgi:hypothetical protein